MDFTMFGTVAENVAVLFILIGVGFAAAKLRVFDGGKAAGFTDVVLYISGPCIIVRSFLQKFDSGLLANLWIALLASLCLHAGSILIAHLAFRKKRGEAEIDPAARVMRFATVFSNAGYMSLPLQLALLGQTGVFYGAAYVAVLNLVLWSYGLWCMNGGSGGFSARKIFLNPGTLGFAAGLLVFLLPVTLPGVITGPVGFLADLNTPLSMLIIGFYLAKANLPAAFRDKRNYAVMGLRLIAIPLLALGGMSLCGMRGPLLLAMTVAVSAPTAAAATIFAAKFGQDAERSVNLVSVTTVLAIATMPVIVTLAKMMG